MKRKWTKPRVEVREFDSYSEIIASGEPSVGENGTPIMPIFEAEDFSTTVIKKE